MDSPPASSPSGDDGERLTALFHETHADLVRFVRARTSRRASSTADDVVAETYLTAWRRLDVVPQDLSGSRAWLFTTARHVLLDDARRERRRDHLPLDLDLGVVAASDSDLDAGVAARLDMAAAVRPLGPADQEVLGTAVVDQLDPAEGAAVLGISPAESGIPEGTSSMNRAQPPVEFTDTELDDLLRSVVTAPTSQEADPTSPRARDLLAAILATPRGTPPARAARGARAARRAGGRVHPSRRPRARLFALAAGGALLATAGVVVPTAMQPAFAAWTRVPTLVTGGDSEAMADGCRELFRDVEDGAEPRSDGTPPAPDVDRRRTVVAERRGSEAFVLVEGDGWYASCLVRERRTSGVVRLLGGTRGISGGGSLTPVDPDLDVPADGLAEVQRGGSGGSGTLTPPWAYEEVTARVGDDVRGVVLHTVRGDVTAALAGGYATAWWPLDVGGSGGLLRTGAEADAASTRVDAAMDAAGQRPVSATLTLADGSTHEVADIDEFAYTTTE